MNYLNQFTLKKVLTVSLAFLMYACGDQKVHERSGPVVITGKVKNYHKTNAKFSYREYKLFSSQKSNKVAIDSDGTFKTSIKTDHPFKGFFMFGKVPATYKIHVKTPRGKDSTFTQGTNDFRMVYLYAQPGDSIHMQVDVKQIAQTVSFSGSNAQNSVFVNKEDQKFDNYQALVRNNSYNIATWGPHKYEEIINQQKKQKLHFLKNYQKSHDISDHLAKVYRWKYIGDATTAKIYYKIKHDRFTGASVKLPSNYYDFMDEVPTADNFSNKGIGYLYSVDGYLKKKYNLKTGHEADGKEYYQFVKKQVDGKSAYEYLAFALGRDFNRTLYDQFDKDCPYPKLAKRVKQNYKHLKGMLAGSPEPKVSFENLSGKSVPLSKFKGHYVYLDFWATWCKPCIEEIPDLEKLKKEYKNRNIKFISISLDNANRVEKWKKFVHNHDNMTSLQFHADSTNNKKISKALNIQMIPRFVLIDNKGKIVDAKAPRPSHKKAIKKLLNDNL